MLNIPRIFCIAVSMLSVLFISNSVYAKRAVTTSESLEIKGNKSQLDPPVEYKHPGIPNTRLSIIMNGVRAEGYTQGLITVPIEKVDEKIRAALSDEDYDILGSVDIHVDARCVGSSGKEVELDPSKGTVLTCEKGEGLELDIFDPQFPHAAVFTLTKTVEVEDEKPAIRLTTAVTSSLAQPVGKKLVGKRSISPYPAVTVNGGSGCGIQ